MMLVKNDKEQEKSFKMKRAMNFTSIARLRTSLF